MERAARGDGGGDDFADCADALPLPDASNATSHVTAETARVLATLPLTPCPGGPASPTPPPGPTPPTPASPPGLAPSDPAYPFVARTTQLMITMTRFRPTTLAVCRDGSVVLAADKTAPSAAKVVDLFQVIGERNSGTTWLHKLITDNTAPDALQPTYLNQWKHAAVTAAQVAASTFAHRTIFVVCVKVREWQQATPGGKSRCGARGGQDRDGSRRRGGKARLRTQ